MANAIKSMNRAAVPGDAPGDRIDVREQLFNEGLTGPVWKIQLPAAAVTRVHGILFDFDPKLIRPDNTVFPFAKDPHRFFEGVEPVLTRHPLTRQAEVRVTGTGIHVIPRIEPAVELSSAAEQHRFATIVRSVQCSLPTDPNAPGITALTRAVGSINAKNGATVEVIRPGVPIDQGDVEDFLQQLLKTPFKTVATVLLGNDRVQPCPVCRGEGTRLDVLDGNGKCYSHCGIVTLAMLFDCIFRPFEPPRQAGDRGAGKPAPPRRPGTGKRPAAPKSSRN